MARRIFWAQGGQMPCDVSPDPATITSRHHAHTTLTTHPQDGVGKQPWTRPLRLHPTSSEAIQAWTGSTRAKPFRSDEEIHESSALKVLQDVKS
jgi:hypothetical protein